MAGVSPELVTGCVVPILTHWLSDQLPRPGLPASENERRIRNIVLAIMVGFGVAYIARELTKGIKTQTVCTRRIVLPGYYGD